MDPNYVTDLGYDRQIFKSLSENYDCCELIRVNGRVDDLERTDVFVLGYFVGKGSVDDDAVDVVHVAG